MKKIVLMMAMACAVTAVSAQEKGKEMKYRRSSLYTIMVPSDKLTGKEEKIVTAAFDEIPLSDKYNDHNLAIRHMDLTKIEVTPEEIQAIKDTQLSREKKATGLLKKGINAIKTATSTSETGKMTDWEKVARIQKWLDVNHIANKIISKWYNENKKLVNGSHFNTELINKRGIVSASKEDLEQADKMTGGRNEIETAAQLDLISRSFVLVTSYAYKSYDEMEEEFAAVADAVGSVAASVGGAGKYVALGTSLAKKGANVYNTYKNGYFIVATSYLFQLNWDEEIKDKFEKYWKAKDLTEFHNSPDFSLSYIDQTTRFSLVQTGAKGDVLSEAAIRNATMNATEASIARLQRKYEPFRTLSELHFSEDGSTMFAYIGKKEDVKAGDKYVVLQKEERNGIVDWYPTKTTIEVAKGKVWDNRYGIEEKAPNTESNPEDGDVDVNAQYTTFKKSKTKFELGGVLIRLK